MLNLLKNICGKSQINKCEELVEEYLRLKKIKNPILPKEIIEYYSLFTKSKYSLVTALIYNPLEKINKNDLKKIKEIFEEPVYKNVLLLDSLHKQKNINTDNVDILALFLIGYKFILENNKKISQKEAKYALKILESTDIFKLREELEDQFFSIIEPEIFQKYEDILYINNSAYKKYENKVGKILQKTIKNAGIKAKFESRIKTIYSTHQKIINKNIFLSQVLDLIGFRVIVKNISDCYRIMEIILSLVPILNSKIKDYIALPKENGYQSIHLIALFDDHPVEIQIRTNKMHHHAQYGNAAHRFYKNYEK